jgi:acetoin utilization deacetylase AcuC-like enzyme
MPVVYDERHRGHRDITGVWLGVPLPGDEEPERADILRAALAAHGARVVEASEHGDAPLLAVHDPEFVACLDSAYARWVDEGHTKDPGQPLVMPYVFSLPGLAPAGRARRPATVRADIGRFATDTMTPLAAGTFVAARAAFDAALTACDLVHGGERAAYALTRPPGHHAGRDFFGGSCYLNHAAGAAQYLRDLGYAQVAVVDVDAHHGNGTQSIFYARADVWFGSVHVDPAAGWYPHFVGFADERGTGPGDGANHNLPLPEGAGDAEWVDAVATACALAAATRPDAVVVSLGVDAAAEDPNSPLLVSDAGFRVAGAAIAGLEAPTVFVQEGGYVVETLAGHVLALLDGFAGGV